MGILFLLGCCWWSMFFELIVPLCIPAPFNLRWGGVLPPIPFFRAHLCCIPIQAILSCIVRSVSFPFFLEKLQKSNIHTSSSKLNNSSLQDQACYVLWHIGTFFGEIFSEVTFSSFYFNCNYIINDLLSFFTKYGIWLNFFVKMQVHKNLEYSFRINLNTFWLFLINFCEFHVWQDISHFQAPNTNRDCLPKFATGNG